LVNRLEAEFSAAIAEGRTAVAAEIQADLDAAKTVLNTIKAKVDPSPAVSDLIKTFRGKGADKAIDTLLKGKFSTFFNMKMEEASYAGSLKLAAAAVVRMDLTVNKFGETRLRRQVISVTEDTDPDYDFSDSEAQAPKLDGPVQLDFHASTTDALPALDYHLEWPEKGEP
jgi:hypothetical protein